MSMLLIQKSYVLVQSIPFTPLQTLPINGHDRLRCYIFPDMFLSWPRTSWGRQGPELRNQWSRAYPGSRSPLKTPSRPWSTP